MFCRYEWEISAASLLKRHSFLPTKTEDTCEDGKHLLFLTHRGKATPSAQSLVHFLHLHTKTFS